MTPGAAAAALERIGTYRNGASYPFCPGCGHGTILDRLDAALVRLQLDPRRVVIVSDIGCVGLSDQYFETNAFHGLHGRSIAYATGIKLVRPDLKVVVVTGDGGCGIGGAHLLSAARRNIGITVLVFNNLNFGMTGGQHSVTTPPGARTATTLTGNLERPLDLCATVAANGASYVLRGTTFDRDLDERIAEAIECDGFSLLDVWELCTAYYVPNNAFSRKALEATLVACRFETGVLHREARPEFASACRQGIAGTVALPRLVKPRFAASLDRPFGLVLAGSAGGKVRSAARLLATAGLLSGLRAAQRDDYPVTVKTGYSVSELVLSPDLVDDAGMTRPDAAVIASPEGLSQVRRSLAAMTPAGRVFVPRDLADAATPARRVVVDLGPAASRATRALSLLAAAVRETGIVSLEALRAAAAEGTAGRSDQALQAVECGLTARCTTA